MLLKSSKANKDKASRDWECSSCGGLCDCDWLCVCDIACIEQLKRAYKQGGEKEQGARGVFSSVVQIFHLHVSHSIRARRLQTLKISSTASTENYRVSFSVHRSVVIYHNKWVTKGKQIIINYKCEQSSFSLDTQLTPTATTLHSSVRSRFVSRRFGTRSVCVQYKWMAHKFVYTLAKG